MTVTFSADDQDHRNYYVPVPASFKTFNSMKDAMAAAINIGTVNISRSNGFPYYEGSNSGGSGSVDPRPVPGGTSPKDPPNDGNTGKEP